MMLIFTCKIIISQVIVKINTIDFSNKKYKKAFTKSYIYIYTIVVIDKNEQKDNHEIIFTLYCYFLSINKYFTKGGVFN